MSHFRSFQGQKNHRKTQFEIQTLFSPLKPKVRAKVLAILKTIFREAVLLELMSIAPMLGIQNPAPIVQMRKFLTWDELNPLEFGAYTTQVKFLALQGLRWGEAVVLSQSEIRAGRIYVTTAQKLMGHSDPKITMTIYTRVLDHEIDNAGAILRRLAG